MAKAKVADAVTPISVDTDDPLAVEETIAFLRALLPDTKKVWAVTFDGVTTEIRDLPWEPLQKIADENHVLFEAVVEYPEIRASIRAAIVQAIADQRGTTCTLELTARVLDEIFHRVEDDLPADDEPEDSDAPPTGGGPSTA